MLSIAILYFQYIMERHKPMHTDAKLPHFSHSTARESPQKLQNIRTANTDNEDHMQIDGKNGPVESNNNVSEEIISQSQTCYHIRQRF